MKSSIQIEIEVDPKQDDAREYIYKLSSTTD
jgi:hypothetical protein